MLQSNLFFSNPRTHFPVFGVLLSVLFFSSCKEPFDPLFGEIGGDYTGRYIKIESGLRMVAVTDPAGGVYFTERLVHDTTITEVFTAGVSKIAPDSLQIAVDIPLTLLSDLHFPFKHEPSGLYAFSTGTSYPFGYRSEDVEVEIDANTERLSLVLVSRNYQSDWVTHIFEGVRE
jgi:hypothetical protein